LTIEAYDVVILDRDLPRVHGDEVCQQIVAAGGETWVLILTAAAGIRDRVDGLDLGANDDPDQAVRVAELVRSAPALPDSWIALMAMDTSRWRCRSQSRRGRAL
jgi:DNA-binding response OmpR family regulator